jgi:hypothetical protein
MTGVHKPARNGAGNPRLKMILSDAQEIAVIHATRRLQTHERTAFLAALVRMAEGRSGGRASWLLLASGSR